MDRIEPLSFLSTLKALGITSLEKIRKVVAKRTFETHDLMLRSYYAVKFSSSPQVEVQPLPPTLAPALAIMKPASLWPAAAPLVN